MYPPPAPVSSPLTRLSSDLPWGVKALNEGSRWWGDALPPCWAKSWVQSFRAVSFFFLVFFFSTRLKIKQK